MFKGDWIKPLAVCGVISALVFCGLSAWWHEHETHAKERQYAATHDTNAPQKPVDGVCFKISNRGIACTFQQPETVKVGEHTKADLKAQQDTSEWTFVAMLISGGSMIVTAIGIYYVHKTLMETRRISSRELRAYMSITPTPGRATNSTVNSVTGDFFLVRAQFNNVGSTPALDCNGFADIVVVQSGGAPDLPPVSFFKTGAMCFPGSSNNRTGATQISNAVAAFEGKVTIFVVLGIYYKDVFSNEIRETTTRLRAHFSKNPVNWVVGEDLGVELIAENDCGRYS